MHGCDLCSMYYMNCFVHVHVPVVVFVLLVDAEVVVEESFDARRRPVFEPKHVTAGSDDFAVDHRYFLVCFEQKLPVVFVHRNIGLDVENSVVRSIGQGILVHLMSDVYRVVLR